MSHNSYSEKVPFVGIVYCFRTGMDSNLELNIGYSSCLKQVTCSMESSSSLVGFYPTNVESNTVFAVEELAMAVCRNLASLCDSPTRRGFRPFASGFDQNY